MKNLRILIRSTYIGVALGLVATVVMPVSLLVSAEECLPPPDTGAGVHRPVGADAAAFTYDCGSGLWKSAHYTYNPATGLTTANDQPVYTYNPATGGYDTVTWVYNAPTNSYVTYTKSVANPPAGATVVGAPVPVATGGAGGSGNSISNTGPSSNNTINNTGGVTNGSSIAGTGPNSNNTINGTVNNTLNATNNTTAGLTNNITAVANTGNALTIGNTTAGGAASGNAQDIANVVNLLQSSSNALGGNTVTFVANINGDVNGDLLFDPAQIGSVQPAGITSPVGTNNLNLNNSLNASINNNIDLVANSGTATVAGNTNGGDAASGSATTIANVVNLINSAITSGKSFLGVVNINGNLNGDILIPPNFVDQLIAANVPTVSISATGPNSNNAITTSSGSNNTNVTNTNNQGITNNVNATATSGTAGVTNNTAGGSATSGNAKTNITAFNLTGSQVIGSNSLLVFVNVLGTWVGLIVNAPPGATAAQLGGGITTNNTSANNNTNIDNNTNQTINNNIRTAAASGDASVNSNTRGGDARSGDAKGAVNLLNVQNSSLALSGWFGILFINVFGTWNGSFGVNTSAGDPVAAGGGQGGGNPASPPASFVPAQFATFLPKTGNVHFTVTGGANGQPSVNSSGATTNATDAVNAVLSAGSKKVAANNKPRPTLEQAQSNFRKIAAIIATGVILFILGDAYYSNRRAHSVGKV